jgi:hypothetical protein
VWTYRPPSHNSKPGSQTHVRNGMQVSDTVSSSVSFESLVRLRALLHSHSISKLFTPSKSPLRKHTLLDWNYTGCRCWAERLWVGYPLQSDPSTSGIDSSFCTSSLPELSLQSHTEQRLPRRMAGHVPGLVPMVLCNSLNHENPFVIIGATFMALRAICYAFIILHLRLALELPREL